MRNHSEWVNFNLVVGVFFGNNKDVILIETLS